VIPYFVDFDSAYWWLLRFFCLEIYEGTDGWEMRCLLLGFGLVGMYIYLDMYTSQAPF
jgi:hypothetical protein